MAVTLRLARHGQKKRPFYRIVATEQSKRRDGGFIELLGTYNPMVDPPAVTLREDRVRHWVGEGAQATPKVRVLISKQFGNILKEREERQRAKIQATRKARKERAKARAAK